MGQDVHAVRGVLRLLPARQVLGPPAAGDLHDDPRRQARGGADLGIGVDVHLLLQLHRALPARAADHPHHARPGALRQTPGAGPQEPADRQVRPDCSGTI